MSKRIFPHPQCHEDIDEDEINEELADLEPEEEKE